MKPAKGMPSAQEIRQAREDRQRKKLAAAKVRKSATLPAGTFTHEMWEGDRPPITPAPDHPLKGDEARRLVRWLLNYCERPPRVPLSPSVTYWFQRVREGKDLLVYSRWNDVITYVQRVKRDKGPQSVQMQIKLNIGGGGVGLSLLPRR